MERQLAHAIRTLFTTQPLGSLGTLHDGGPYVSMVPFAVLPDGSAFVIHVSTLAAHTKDMLADPRVGLMVIASPAANVPPQATARVMIQGDAEQLSPSGPLHPMAKQAYLGRFPDSAMMFELADFSLFSIRPRSVRFVGGFARAKSITPESLAEALRA